VNRLLSFGLVDNVTLFPHGVQDHPKTDRHSLKVRLGFGNKTVIGSYGFLLPHKGILELIEAFALMQKELPDSVLLLVNALYPSPSSTRLLNDCQSLAKELGVDSRVIRIHEFLPDDESRTLLEAADVVVFPYQNTNESSSAAVRLALAAHAPIACTPLGIFEDIDSVHVRLPGTKPDQIAAGLLDFLKSQTAAAELSGRLESWLKEHSWERCALRLKAMLLDAERRGTGVT
jgi:glycosyltransferase involved in cell wall biosynthesis